MTTSWGDNVERTTTAFTYDANRNLLTLRDARNSTTTYTYNGMHRADTRQDALLRGESFGYDDANRLTSITQGAAVTGSGYDAADRRTTLTLPNGIVVTTTYDVASQVTGLTYALGAATLGTLTYTYDTDGLRTTIGGTWARTGLPPALASATYDAANQLTLWGGAAVTYDANGSLTSDGAATYTWNTRNQVTSVAGTTPASFAYDAVGRRRTRTVGGTSTGFLYDGLNLVQEPVGGTPTAQILPGLGIDEWLQRTDTAGTRSFLTDALGSTLALTDNTGAVQTQYTYAPFGASTTTGAATTNPFGFTGREQDTPTLDYYRNRFYSPVLQRFLSEDPLEFGGGDANLFAYVANQPVGVIDALGLAQHGKRNLEVNLPTGETLNKKTPLELIERALDKAIDQGWSKKTLESLKTLGKVVRRGGEMGLLLELLDPQVLESAECPFGPGTCRPRYPPDPPNGYPQPPGRKPGPGSRPGPGTPGGRPGRPGLPGAPGMGPRK